MHTMVLFYWRLANPAWMLILLYALRLSLGTRSVIFTVSLTSHKSILRPHAREKMRETVEVQTFLLSSVETMTGMVMQSRDNIWESKKEGRRRAGKWIHIRLSVDWCFSALKVSILGCGQVIRQEPKQNECPRSKHTLRKTERATASKQRCPDLIRAEIIENKWCVVAEVLQTKY